jgi:hypothetical protein
MATPSDADPILRDDLKRRAGALKLYGLLAHWDETPEAELPWVRRLIAWEEVERRRRGLERRLGAAHIVLQAAGRLRLELAGAVRQGCRVRVHDPGLYPANRQHHPGRTQKWFPTIYPLTQRKKSTSALQFSLEI